MNILAICSTLVGFLIRAMALRATNKVVKEFWRIIKPMKLVKKGIYKHIRHPMYLGSILSCFGISLLLTKNIGVSIMFVVVLTNFLLARIDQEEQMLVFNYGVEYIEYMKRTKMLIPFVF
jgi:protein-S-isoprenylcysteine O-methyltransferase Ste14